MVFCFPGAEKGCIGNKWVNMSFLHLTESINLKNHNTNFLLNFRYIFIFRWNLYKADIICYINKYFVGECFVCYEIVGRGFLPPPLPPTIFYEDHPTPCLPPIFKILPKPPLPIASTPTAPFVVLFLWLNG